MAMSGGQATAQQNVRKASTTSEGDGWTCEECGKVYRKERDKLLECEYCEKHYCIKCLKYKPVEYEAMRKPGCMWFCMPCKPKIEKNILNEKLIEERCELYFRTLIARIEEIERKLETKCDAHENQDIIRKEIGTDKGRSPQVTPSDTAKESGGVLRETINEIQDRKARESSFLIVNAPEPDTNLKEVRGLKEKELVQGLGSICDVNINLHDINEVIILGEKHLRMKSLGH